MIIMKWIKDYRERLRLSQEDLAAQLQVRGIDITRASVSHWENGRAKPPMEDSFFVTALADALKIDVQTILRLSGYAVVGKHTAEAERIAGIVDKLTERDRRRILKIVETFLEE